MKKLVVDRKNYLPHQFEFLRCDKKMKLLLCGFGAGKTYVFLREALKQHIFNVNPATGTSNIWIIYPTLDLARDLFIDDFKDLLDAKEIQYTYKEKEMSFKSKYGKLRIYTLERPDRMVGSNLTAVGIDEFDTSKYKNAMAAYKKILGRLRGSEKAQLFIVTTPEGFHAAHTIFVENADEDKIIIRAKTSDNPYLPSGYIETLKKEYDEKLLEAYFNGNFVNLHSGIVYYGFNYKLDVVEDNSLKINPALPLRIYFDFNVKPFIIGYGQHKDKSEIKAIGEVAMPGHSNTEAACRELTNRIKPALAKELDVVIYGDAAGSWTGTKSKSSDYDLIDKVFRPYFKSITYKVPRSNPGVRNRINIVNTRLSKRCIKINKCCTYLIRDYIQVCYAKNGIDIDKSNLNLTHPSDGHGYYLSAEFPIDKPNWKEQETRSL